MFTVLYRIYTYQCGESLT